VERFGQLSVFHYDPYAQALAKIERGHAQDLRDIKSLFNEGLIAPDALMELYEKIEDELFRYPAIEPSDFRSAVTEAVAEMESGS